MPEKVCGDCKFWHRQPADPSNLGAPPQGQCRHSPPSTTIIPQQGRMGVVMANLSTYPPLPENFPACHQHKTRLSLDGVMVKEDTGEA